MGGDMQFVTELTKSSAQAIRAEQERAAKEESTQSTTSSVLSCSISTPPSVSSSGALSAPIATQPRTPNTPRAPTILGVKMLTSRGNSAAMRRSARTKKKMGKKIAPIVINDDDDGMVDKCAFVGNLEVLSG